MHGWGSDQRNWDAFEPHCQQRGWPLQRLDRGYGRYPEQSASWLPQGRRALLLSSLGSQLVPSDLLQQADAVVLLASFGRFVPAGAAGRPLQQALRLMDQRLDAGDLLGLFADFRIKVAEPQAVEHLPPGIEDGPVSTEGLQRLRQDLELLRCCQGLPGAFPEQAAVLIVEAMADTIVHPNSRAALRQELPQAELVELAGVGHGLLSPGLCEQVVGWLDALP